MINVLRFVNIEAPPRPEPTRGLILAAAGHAAPAETPVVAARTNLGLLETGLGRELEVIKATKERIAPVPTPPASPTLQDLIKRARRQLAGSQQQARQIEMETHHAAVVTLLASIQPER